MKAFLLGQYWSTIFLDNTVMYIGKAATVGEIWSYSEGPESQVRWEILITSDASKGLSDNNMVDTGLGCPSLILDKVHVCKYQGSLV